jgi:hypothetical protein
MRGLIQILSVLSLLFGALVALLGTAAMLYAKWAPAQPPPNLNEGAGLAGFLGFFMTIAGSVSVLTGLAMQAGLRRWPDRRQLFLQSNDNYSYPEHGARS